MCMSEEALDELDVKEKHFYMFAELLFQEMILSSLLLLLLLLLEVVVVVVVELLSQEDENDPEGGEPELSVEEARQHL